MIKIHEVMFNVSGVMKHINNPNLRKCMPSPGPDVPSPRALKL